MLVVYNGTFDCSGSATLLFGDATYCAQILSAVSGGTFRVDNIFLSCNAANANQFCAYSATYTVDVKDTAATLTCTTGQGNVNYLNQTLFQGAPSPTSNTFATNAQAPFATDTCYTPAQAAGPNVWSYKAYCNSAQVPNAVAGTVTQTITGQYDLTLPQARKK